MLGIVGAGDLGKVGRVGVKSLVYFEVVSTLALIIGLVIVNMMRPGDRFNVDPATLDASAVASYTNAAAAQTQTSSSSTSFHAHSRTPFPGSGDMLQVLFTSILFAFAPSRIGAKGEMVHRFLAQASHVFFGMMNLVMKLAPIGAGAAMAFTFGAPRRGRVVAAGEADGRLLLDVPRVRRRRARPHRRLVRIQHRPVHPVQIKDEVLTVLGPHRQSRRWCR